MLLKETAPRVDVSLDLNKYPINIPIIINIVVINIDRRIIVKKFEENTVIGILKTKRLIMNKINNWKVIITMQVIYVEKKKIVLFVGVILFLKCALDVFSIITKLEASKIAINIIIKAIKLGKK